MAKKNRKPSKMEELVERYGPAAFVTWFAVFFSTIGMFYGLLSMGVDLDALVLRVLSWWGSDGSSWKELTEGADSHWLGFLGAKLVVSYLGAQVVKPLRIALVVVLTPIVGRLMGRTAPSPDQPAPDADAADEDAAPTQDS